MSSTNEDNAQLVSVRINSLDVNHVGNFFLTAHLLSRRSDAIAYPKQETTRTKVSPPTKRVTYPDATFKFDPSPLLGDSSPEDEDDPEDGFAPPQLAKQSSESDDSDPSLLAGLLASRYRPLGRLVVCVSVYEIWLTSQGRREHKSAAIGKAKVSLAKLASLRNLRLPVLNDQAEIGEVDISYGEEMHSLISLPSLESAAKLLGGGEPTSNADNTNATKSKDPKAPAKMSRFITPNTEAPSAVYRAISSPGVALPTPTSDSPKKRRSNSDSSRPSSDSPPDSIAANPKPQSRPFVLPLWAANSGVLHGSLSYSVRCFGVFNLHQPTRSFLTVKTTVDAAANRTAHAGTSTSALAKSFMLFDPFTVVVQEADMKTPVGLLVSLIDAVKKTYIAKCIIPTRNLIPGESYNLALMLDNRGASFVLMTIILQPTVLFWSSLFTKYTELCRLEVFLHGVRPLEEIEGKPSTKQSDIFVSGPVVAAFHVELNLTSYIRKIGSQDPAVPFQRFSLSDPVAFENLVPTTHQLSAPSSLGVYPAWNCLLEFTNTFDELFDSSAALVVELFSMNFQRDALGEVKYLGWASVPLSTLTRPGIRDGTDVHQAPELQLKDQSNQRFVVNINLRRWSSHAFVKQLTKVEFQDQIGSPQMGSMSQGSLRGWSRQPSLNNLRTATPQIPALPGHLSPVNPPSPTTGSTPPMPAFLAKAVAKGFSVQTSFPTVGPLISSSSRPPSPGSPQAGSPTGAPLGFGFPSTTSIPGNIGASISAPVVGTPQQSRSVRRTSSPSFQTRRLSQPRNNAPNSHGFKRTNSAAAAAPIPSQSGAPRRSSKPTIEPIQTTRRLGGSSSASSIDSAASDWLSNGSDDDILNHDSSYSSDSPPPDDDSPSFQEKSEERSWPPSGLPPNPSGPRRRKMTLPSTAPDRPVDMYRRSSLDLQHSSASAPAIRLPSGEYLLPPRGISAPAQVNSRPASSSPSPRGSKSQSRRSSKGSLSSHRSSDALDSDLDDAIIDSESDGYDSEVEKEIDTYPQLSAVLLKVDRMEKLLAKKLTTKSNTIRELRKDLKKKATEVDETKAENDRLKREVEKLAAELASVKGMLTQKPSSKDSCNTCNDHTNSSDTDSDHHHHPSRGGPRRPVGDGQGVSNSGSLDANGSKTTHTTPSGGKSTDSQQTKDTMAPTASEISKTTQALSNPTLQALPGQTPPAVVKVTKRISRPKGPARDITYEAAFHKLITTMTDGADIFEDPAKPQLLQPN